MSSWDDLLWLISVLFSSILAGGVVTVSLAVIPALHVFDPKTDFRVHKVFNPLPDYYMPQSLFISAFAVLGVLIGGGDLRDLGTTAAIAGLVLSVPIILISLLLNRRFNLVIRRWTADTLPPDYERRRRVWDRAHISRTILCVILLGCYCVAAGPGRRTGDTAPALTVANVMLAAMMAGGLLMVQLAVIPTFHRLPDELGARFHVAVDRYIEYSLPAFTVLTAASAVAVLLVRDDLPGTQAVLVAVGLVATIAVALISHLCNRPLNVELRTWPMDALPARYQTLRSRWDRFHVMRTMAGLVALVCFVIPLIAGP
jgi:uncharacterized membrane protein